MAEFTDNIERINRLAEASDGFVWRLAADEDSTYGMAAGSSDVILMSVWRSLALLRSFVFQTEHVGYLRRRREWFVPYGGPHVALWWVSDGSRPTLEEAFRRLAHLEQHGPSDQAFTCSPREPPP